MPELAGYGEDRLVAALLSRLPLGVTAGPEVVAGAGDDCAVLNVGGVGAPLQLLKTDCVIEGVHYTTNTPPTKVGWKALCRPLSDIAAMGGRPLHALVTLALPGSAALDYAQAIYDGLGQAAERFGVRIVGGETARSPSGGFLSVVLTGEVAAHHAVTRSGGRVGDAIYVTGALGGSLTTGKHLDFVPRLREAQWLAAHFRPSGMMDLSDGLGRDLPRLAAASGVGYTIERARVPCTSGCSVDNALSDGEDYELLFTITPANVGALEANWPVAWPDLQLTRIGELASAPMRANPVPGGYDHFALGD